MSLRGYSEKESQAIQKQVEEKIKNGILTRLNPKSSIKTTTYHKLGITNPKALTAMECINIMLMESAWLGNREPFKTLEEMGITNPEVTKPLEINLNLKFNN